MGGCNIHLEHGDAATEPGGGAVYLLVGDADQLADDWREAGVEVVGAEDFGWGKREGSHEDPDGNVIRFGSPRPVPKAALPKARSLDLHGGRSVPRDVRAHSAHGSIERDTTAPLAALMNAERIVSASISFAMLNGLVCQRF